MENFTQIRHAECGFSGWKIHITCLGSGWAQDKPVIDYAPIDLAAKDGEPGVNQAVFLADHTNIYIYICVCSHNSNKLPV